MTAVRKWSYVGTDKRSVDVLVLCVPSSGPTQVRPAGTGPAGGPPLQQDLQQRRLSDPYEADIVVYGGGAPQAYGGGAPPQPAPRQPMRRYEEPLTDDQHRKELLRRSAGDNVARERALPGEPKLTFHEKMQISMKDPEPHHRDENGNVHPERKEELDRLHEETKHEVFGALRQSLGGEHAVMPHKDERTKPNFERTKEDGVEWDTEEEDEEAEIMRRLMAGDDEEDELPDRGPRRRSRLADGKTQLSGHGYEEEGGPDGRGPRGRRDRLADGKTQLSGHGYEEEGGPDGRGPRGRRDRLADPTSLQSAAYVEEDGGGRPDGRRAPRDRLADEDPASLQKLTTYGYEEDGGRGLDGRGARGRRCVADPLRPVGRGRVRRGEVVG